VFEPGPASVEFLGEESEGFLPGMASRLLYLVTNPGASRDFAVSVQDPGGGIVASPDPPTLHVDSGSAARFSVTVSVPSDTPMFQDFDLRITVAASDDNALHNSLTQMLLVEGR
jgi:hypothetical protein